MATASRQKSLATDKQPSSLLSEEYVPMTMPKKLGTFDMTATFIVSIFLVTTATTAVIGGPAAITYLVIAGVGFFLPCLIATAHLGLMFQNEGALYNWTHHAIGGRASFFAGFCAWFPGVLITTSLANLLVIYIQSMKSSWLTLPWQQGLVICGVLILTCLISIQRFRTVQNVINVLVCLTVFACLLIGASCFVWLATRHASATNLGHWSDYAINPGNVVLFGFMVFAYIGTEGPLTMAAEIKERGKASIIKRHLLLGGGIIMVLYLLTTISTLIVLGPTNGATPFALVTVVDTALGKFWGSIAAVCLMGSFISTTLVYTYVFARLLMVGGIDGRLPARVAKLNGNRVPANAIVFQTVLALAYTLIAFVLAPLVGIGDSAVFPAQLYNVSQAAAVLVWAISASFLFIDLIACYRKFRQGFKHWLFLPMPLLWLCIVVGVTFCIGSIVDTLLYSWTSLITNSQWALLVGAVTLVFLIVATLGSMYANSEASWQSFQE
jgi:glutamate:GABA antiporter